jgi:hypothetical protein
MYTRVFLRKFMNTFKSVKLWGRTTVQELLGFASVVYTFMYFSVGHFPDKGALVRFVFI